MGLRDPRVLQGHPQGGGGRDRQRLRGLPGQPRPEGGHRPEGVREARHPHHPGGRLRYRGGQRVHQHHDGHPHRARGRGPRARTRLPVLRPVHQLLRGAHRRVQADRGRGLEARHRHDPQEDHQQDQGHGRHQPQQPHRRDLRREGHQGDRRHLRGVRHPPHLGRDLRQDRHGGRLLLRIQAPRRRAQGHLQRVLQGQPHARMEDGLLLLSWTRSARA